jgi:demethylmenaquinone methyltransferase/2-methoxy-6-polyprenyl-1,4-benzoquinol methylase
MIGMSTKIYPDSGVELTPFTAKYYDKVMNIGFLGVYKRFIKKVIDDMDIQPEDNILDLGCGTGRNAGLMADYLSNKGQITGLDISEDMEKQFRDRFSNDNRIEFINRRIDQPFDLEKKYDKVFISFVIHGFPHEVRDAVIKNAKVHLKPGGSFFILDFAEFDIDKMPPLHRFIFKKVECIYAFDFIKRDWKEILKGSGFDNFSEHIYMKKYVRLLTSRMNG